MQIDQFQPSGASSPQVVWFAGTSHVSIRGLRGIVDVSFALGLVYVGTMRGTCVFCWILDDGGEKVSWSWWWKEIQVVFFKIRQTWKFKGPFFIVFCGDYFLGACNKNWLPLLCADSISEAGIARIQKSRNQGCSNVCLFSHPLWAGKLWFPLFLTHVFRQFHRDLGRRWKIEEKWWWFSKGIWRPKMPNKNANFRNKKHPRSLTVRPFSKGAF